ncbi:hypothetical protein Aperf_G00000045467 [Anoplocephala perfoliata]
MSSSWLSGLKMSVRLCKASRFLIDVIVVLLSIKCASSQSLKALLNPGCTNCSGDLYVLTVSYQGSNFSAHYVISLTGTRRVPSVFLSTSKVNSTLQINWTSILNDVPAQPAVYLENSSFYGLLFTHLYQYKDRLDLADISEYADSINRILANQCFWFIDRWDPKPDPLSGLLSVNLKCNDPKQAKILDKKGEIEMQFTFSENDQNSKSAPYTLLVGGLAVRIKFVLKRLYREFLETRYAVGIALVSNTTLPPDAFFTNTTSVSIDDEASPGAYKDITIFLSNNSYATWRSVCYINASSTEVKTSRGTRVSSQSSADKSTLKLIKKSSFLPFIYGANLPAVRLVNMSFGDPGDGFYRASKYIQWSLDMGLSTPPRSHFSLLVWVIVCITIAVLVLAIGLLIFVSVWRFCLQRSTYEGYERALLNDCLSEQDTA